ncbi:hypothetical protein SCHPADRAFT_901860 [Schizopora paradoxa]|uniref:Uncharacterized protein n=1 Tax=Schizopora paradoxa TaxID=27342 RepID=A0A0H2SG67_9AGAM|nr:hypothetical protein SCHPADRAFT_901860 [Schizopora paradoxa]
MDIMSNVACRQMPVIQNDIRVPCQIEYDNYYRDLDGSSITSRSMDRLALQPLRSHGITQHLMAE